MTLKTKVIILGAGMSGISCGITLNNNFKVSLYEKSRGVGGRLCAKKTTDGLLHFGAQFCTSQSDQFREFLAKNNAVNFMGSAYEYDKKLTIQTKNYFVHAQGMQGLLKKEAKSLNICFNQKAIHIDEKEKIIYFESGHKETYDIIISSLPLPQCQEIFQSTIEHDSEFSPCVAVGMNIKPPQDNPHIAFKSADSDVSWFASSKFFNSETQETWVLQFAPQASTKMIAKSDQFIQNIVKNYLGELFNESIELSNIKIFRWKYALCTKSNLNKLFTSISEEAYAIGDWNISPRVESAYSSGVALGKFLNETKL